MLFVLSGGGTAGHINPALALAEELISRGHEVHFAGTPQGLESRLVPAAGIPFKAFEATGFNRNHPLTLVKALRLMNKSTKAAKRWFKELDPDGVVGFGGYVCIPVARAAESMGVPVVLHEQNSVMGIANKYLSKKASAVALTYEVAGEGVEDPSKLVITGNPVRKAFLSATREEGREMLGIPDDALVLLVFGGSQGARHINTAVCKLKDRLLAIPDLHVVHITGPKEHDSVVEALALTPEQAARWQVMGYQDAMAETMAAADLIVSRAGASSLAEISARAVPALLIPFPYATADHQSLNAREYVNAGAAYVVPDDRVDSSEFPDLLLQLVEDETLRQSMVRAAQAFDTSQAVVKLADVVIGAVENQGRQYNE